ncbi:unnamed protein product [Orchesella dallaii]|uniref:Gustatory receptor n=1 Tax=Orchesella dallaii TaxID=48710 RepID=A0ABP1PT46_9HEXA
MKKSTMFPTAWGSGDLGKLLLMLKYNLLKKYLKEDTESSINVINGFLYLSALISKAYPWIQDNSAFLNGLKPVVFIGRFLGVLPRSDILVSKQGAQRRFSFPLLFTGFLALFFFVNAILLVRSYFSSLKTTPATSEKLANFGSVVYVWSMFFLYAYFLFTSKRFRNVVLSFQAQGDQPSQFSTKFPGAYVKFCWIMCFACMLFGISENVLYDLQNITKRGKVDSPFRLYYKQNFEHWALFIPYNPVLTFFFVLIIKCGTWGWVSGDIIPIVMSKALTYKLEMMNAEIKGKISPGLMPAKMNATETRMFATTLQGIRTDFMNLLNLSVEVQKFIVPLILSCYAASLFLWIDPYRPAVTAEQSHYAYFAFLNFLYRITSVTYFAAEVHYTSSSILTTIQLCPNAFYTLSLERLEQLLSSNPIGIRLFGSFMISRKSFITIISFVFTTEIVLLQTIKD